VTGLGLNHRLLVVTLVTLAPLAALLAAILYNNRHDAWDLMHDTARRTGLLQSLEIAQVVDGVESVLGTAAASPSVQNGEWSRCDEFLAEVIERLPQIAAISVVEGGGAPRRAACSASRGGMPPLPDDRSFAGLEALVRQGGGDSFTGAFIPEAQGSSATLPVLLASRDAADRAIVMVGHVDLDWLGRRLQTRQLGAGNAITVADRHGTIIAREPMPDDFVGSAIPEAFRHLVSAPVPGTLPLTSQDGTRRVIGYYPASPATGGLYVSAGVAVDQVLAPINRITAISVAIGLLTIVVAVMAGQIANARFIRRPFARLIATVKAWQSGDTTLRTGLDRDASEFGEAGRALDGFMDQLIAARAQRKLAEEQRALLLREHDHRMKNLFATVQAVARQTFRERAQASSLKVFNDRLGAMAKAHEALLSGGLAAASVFELVDNATAPFDDANHMRFTKAGPEFDLADKAAMALAMALHELCTNAAKYGALSNTAGRVAIRWSLHDDGESFTMDWQETGGPPVSRPGASGFGTTMIQSVLAQQIDGTVTIDYCPDGLRCCIAGKTNPA
jgi:two-component sensor histidine kinase